ncbi:MAG: hypothetical protein ACFFDP_09490 [Promethearchaeota archaeon]
MPNLRSRAAVPLGLLTVLIMSTAIYFIDKSGVQSLVYTTYVSFISPNQLYEIAWVLATIDNLLNLTNPLSLILWCILIIGGSLAFHNMNSALKMMGTAFIFPGATWLLFAFKYAPQIGLNSLFLISFFIWRFIIPLGLGLSTTVILTIPFWIINRRQPTTIEKPPVILFVCQRCGAEYRSNPIVCVNCGSEGEIR